MKSIKSLCHLMLFGYLLVVAAPVTAQNRIPWITDLREARDLAERQNRLVMLHFWSETCPPCKRLEQYVFNKPAFIRALTTGYIPVKINVEAQPRLAEFYNVDSWPTDVIVTPNGREVQRFTSKQDPNDYIVMLDGIRARASVNGYVPVASNSGGTFTAGPGYLDSSPSNASPAISQRSPALTHGTSVPQIHDQYVNPLDRSVAPQQQQVAPRYGAPYGQSPDAPGASRGSQWTQNQGAQPNNAGTAEPTENPYAGQASQQQIAPTRNDSLQAPTISQQAPSWQENRYAANQPTQNPPSQSQASPPVHQSTNSAATPGNRPAPPKPQFALDGYCPVTLVHQRVWARGNEQWGARHDGHVYLFAGQEQQQAFLANHHLYAPLLSGFDPVRFAETGQLVAGKREFGLYVDEPGPIALFADEAALERFHGNSAFYFNVIRQAKARQAGQMPRR